MAELVKTARLKPLAELRWMTIVLITKSLGKFMLSFAALFVAADFKGMKDSELLKEVIIALGSNSWLTLEFVFVDWFARLISHLMSWGGGCKCHSPDDRSDEARDCFYKGRRLDEAYEYCRLAWL